MDIAVCVRISNLPKVAGIHEDVLRSSAQGLDIRAVNGLLTWYVSCPGRRGWGWWDDRCSGPLIVHIDCDDRDRLPQLSGSQLERCSDWDLGYCPSSPHTHNPQQKSLEYLLWYDVWGFIIHEGVFSFILWGVVFKKICIDYSVISDTWISVGESNVVLQFLSISESIRLIIVKIMNISGCYNIVMFPFVLGCWWMYIYDYK